MNFLNTTSLLFLKISSLQTFSTNNTLLFSNKARWVSEWMGGREEGLIKYAPKER